MLILPLSFTDALQYFKSGLGTSAKPVMLSSSPAPVDPVMFCYRLFPEKPFQLWPRGHSHDEGSVHELVGWAWDGLQLPGGSIMMDKQKGATGPHSKRCRVKLTSFCICFYYFHCIRESVHRRFSFAAFVVLVIKYIDHHVTPVWLSLSQLPLTFSSCRSSLWGPLTVHRISTPPFWGECPQDFTLISLWVYSQTVHMFISTMNMFYDMIMQYYMRLPKNVFNSC